MSGLTMGFPSVPEYAPNDVEHRRKLAKAINGLLSGRLNAVTTLTLTAGAASTTITDDRITPNSFIGLMPTTANAATALSTTYIPTATKISANGTGVGSAVVQHANNAQTDRTFVVLIIG